MPATAIPFGEVGIFCSITYVKLPAGKTEILKTANNTGWTNIMGYYSASAKVDYKTLCTDADTLRLGGDFRYIPPPPQFGSAYTKYSPSNSNAFFIDSTVNKFLVFRGALIAGGEFVKSNPWQSMPPDLNHIFFRAAKPTPPPPPPPPAQNNGKNIVQGGNNANQGDEQLSVASTQKNTTATIYPNPAKDKLYISNNFGATQFRLYDAVGKLVNEQTINGQDAQITLPMLTAGLYTVELKNNNGERAVEKLTIR